MQLREGNFGLVILGLLPALVFCFLVYIKGKNNKQPKGFLIRLLVFGAVSCFLAVLLEQGGEFILNRRYIYYTVEEMENTRIQKEYLAKYSFGVVAISEEISKFLILWVITRENKNMNSMYDGIVCAVFVSMGFAAFENILYVEQLGRDVALLRTYTAVPAHLFFGVLMGVHHSKWSARKLARRLEAYLVEHQIRQAPKKKIVRWTEVFLALFLPIMAHGAYDYFAFTMEMRKHGETIFYVLLALLGIYCIRKIFVVAKNDKKYILLAEEMNHLDKSN